MIGRRPLALGVGAAALSACARTPTRSAPPPLLHGPPLHSGANLSAWFQLDRSCRPTRAQLAAARRSGLDHVRLPVDPWTIGWRPERAADENPFSLLAELDAAIAMIDGEGLTINLDCHPGSEVIDFLKRNEASIEPVLLNLLRCLVRRYASMGDERISFELSNEPHRYCPPQTWSALQGRLIQDLRQDAGSCWLLANGGYDPISTFRTINKYPDSRVIYAFHYYEPYEVTHQGAGWEPSAANLFPYLDHVPYPSAILGDVAAHIRHGAPDAAYVAGALEKYRAGGWNAARIRQRIQPFIEWRDQNGVPILCTEFGVLRTNIDDDSRVRWIGDVVAALESAGVPWTVWDFCSSAFGVARCGADPAPVEPRAAVALRLKGT